MTLWRDIKETMDILNSKDFYSFFQKKNFVAVTELTKCICKRQLKTKLFLDDLQMNRFICEFSSDMTIH